MNNKNLRYCVRIFLIIAPLFWAFRMVVKYDANIDALIMILFSAMIFKNAPDD